NNVIMQYFANQSITSSFTSSRVLPGAPPATVSQTDVEVLAGQLYARGQLSGFDLGATVFDFMLPRGTILTIDSSSSLQGLGGFPTFESEPDLSLVMQEVPLTDGSGTVPVQFQYSDAVHGPEGPIPAPHAAGRSQNRSPKHRPKHRR